MPLRETRFVADAHLGGLAHMLRMLGFNTLYDNHFQDDEIVAIAGQEDRIVLTRDRELLKRRAVTHGCYVHALKSEPQLCEIVGRLYLARSARPFTLCLHCNLPLRPVDKASVLDLACRPGFGRVTSGSVLAMGVAVCFGRGRIGATCSAFRMG